MQPQGIQEGQRIFEKNSSSPYAHSTLVASSCVESQGPMGRLTERSEDSQPFLESWSPCDATMAFVFEGHSTIVMFNSELHPAVTICNASFGMRSDAFLLRSS